MNRRAVPPGTVIVTDVTTEFGLSREQLIRRIQRGQIEGGKVRDGNWYVTDGAIERAKAGFAEDERLR